MAFVGYNTIMTSAPLPSLGLYPEHDLSQFPSYLKGKRILLCTESFGPVNGVSRTTLMLVNHLRSQGASVAVVAPHNHTHHNVFTPPPSPTLSAADALQQPEVRVSGYPLPFNPELSVVYPVRNSTLYQKTFGEGVLPDLIYLASPASLGFQVMLQLRQQPKGWGRVPVICNFQTDLAGYCKILFPAPLSYFADLAFAAAQSYLFRHSSVKTIFYPSRFVRRYLASQNVQEDKMELLTRGVNTKLFHPQQKSERLRKELAPNGEIIFVTVSRIAGEKGFNFLARAAALMHERGVPFKLLIVGGNRNPDVEKEVQDMFPTVLREKGNVLFTGFKTGTDLAEAYASADVFLHCSVTETFGLVVLESMASGVPVVARDEGGPSDVVLHGSTGYLVPPDDLEGFVARATEIAGDHDLRARMGEACRAAACEATWDKINNKVAWRMADVIAEHRKSLSMPNIRSPEEQQDDITPLSLGAKQLVPVYSWLMMSNAVRELVTKSLVDVRLAGGLGVILSCWLVTGLYMVFTEVTMWTKGRWRI